jgi:AraC family transcriptional regulator, regulatory protein of adaptative response / methylated-DNA-[protein]-cysteine methyltransferase
MTQPTLSTTHPSSSKREKIRYTIAHSPLGFLLLAATDRGLCSVGLGDSIAELEAELFQAFHHASIQQTNTELQEWIQVFMNYLSGKLPLVDLPCDVKATAFQRQVWEALKKIPIGTTTSYSNLACAIGQPTSVRAVARACATNPIALLVPCHRVVPKSGGLGGYRWGISRKQALLDLEKQYSHSTEH